MTLIDRAAADLRLIAEYWPGLAELRDPTVFAPRPPSLLTLERRAELDYEARLERRERIDLAPGEHPDAARAEILDLMAGLAVDADDLVDEIARPLIVVRPDPPSTAFADPTPLLVFAITHLREANDLDPRVGKYVGGIAARMLEQVSRALCLEHDGQTLTVLCPWCKGGLSAQPSLRVQILPGDEVAIVCESDIPCEPPRRKVTTWVHGRPCWPFRDWRWLAKQLHAADQTERKAG